MDLEPSLQLLQELTRRQREEIHLFLNEGFYESSGQQRIINAVLNEINQGSGKSDSSSYLRLAGADTERSRCAEPVSG